MQYFITRQGEQSGPFSDEKFREMVAAGQIAPTDYLWHEPLTEWIFFKDFDTTKVKTAVREYTKYYKIDSRKLTFGEYWSFCQGKPHVFLVVSILKILRIPCTLSQGLPEARKYDDLRIREDELSIEARLSFCNHAIPLAQKGFDLISYAALTNNLMPIQTYVADYLHQDKSVMLRLFYSRSEGPSLTITECISLVTILENGLDITTTNRNNSFKSPPDQINSVIKTSDLEKLIKVHTSNIQKYTSSATIRLIHSPAEFEECAFGLEKKFYDYNVQRGVLVEMTPDEIAAIKMSQSKLKAT